MNYPTSSYSIPLRKIAQGLDKVKWRGDRDFSACCPAHDDKNPSFHARDVDGKILVKCFAGCTQGEVISALRDRGLWSARSYHQKAIEKRKANETALRRHRILLATELARAAQGIPHTHEELEQIKESVRFLEACGYE